VTGANFGTTRRNLLVRTEEFNNNTSWLKASSAITPNQGVAPDGNLTADKFAENTSNAYHQISQAFSSAVSTVYTYSVYAKAAGRNLLVVSFNGTAITGTQVYCFFNLANGTVGTNAGTTSPSIVSVGNGWYRCSVTTTTLGSAGTAGAFLTTSEDSGSTLYVGDGTSGYLLWGAQVEANSTATAYIPSTQTFTSRASGASYFDATGVLQWKPQNLLLQSGPVDTNNGWGKGINTTRIGTETLLGQTATIYQGNGSGGNTFLNQAVNVVSGTTYTLSVYARLVSGTKPTSGALITIETTPGTPGVRASLTYSSSSLASEVARYSVTFTAGATGSTTLYLIADQNNTAQISVFGAQLERVTGSFATPGEYTPTTATATGGARNSAYLPDSSGVFRSAGPLLLEVERTNSIRNNTMVGAVAGTPGTNPTLWQYVTTQSNGLTQTIVGVGVENGITYIDYRFNGTTVASASAVAFGFESNAAAAAGQTWTSSIYLRLVGGTTTGISSFVLGLIENNSGGSFVGGALYDIATPTSASLVTQRYSATRTLTTATAAFCVPTMGISVANSTAIDFTLRIGMPQLEQGAFATSVIPTTSATVTRAADVSTSAATSMFESSFYNQTEGTLFASGDFIALGANSFSRIIGFGGTNAGTDEISFLSRVAVGAGDGSIFGAVTVNSSLEGNLDGPPGYPNLSSAYRSALAYKANDFGLGSNGLTPATDTSGTLPTITQLIIMGSLRFQNKLSGHVRRLTYWPVRLANTTLQQITQP
jgi:hypothetical protein